jgi:hypothetical protein
MRYDKIPDYHEFDRIMKKNTVADCPLWLQKAVEQKSSRVTVELANSKLLTFDTLDKKILIMTQLN